MPASVANAVVSTVLPKLLCASFSQARFYELLVNEYVNGESNRSAVTASSRKSWQIVRPLTATLANELIAFYLARRGPLEAFWIYDPFDTVPLFGFDATGAATSGRYAVHFKGALEISLGVPRTAAQFELEELT